jgi:hypothetical protein
LLVAEYFSPNPQAKSRATFRKHYHQVRAHFDWELLCLNEKKYNVVRITLKLSTRFSEFIILKQQFYAENPEILSIILNFI